MPAEFSEPIAERWGPFRNVGRYSNGRTKVAKLTLEMA